MTSAFTPLKQLLSTIISRTGYSLTKISEFELVPLHPRLPPPTIELLEPVVDFFFPVPATPTLVQIGANDGVAHDPAHHLIKRRGLSAVLVEPVPHIYESLCATYAGNARVKTVSCAISPQRGDIPFYVCKSLDGLELAAEWSSTTKEHLKKFGILDSQIDTIKVRSTTLADLLQETESACDILQVDTEGLDAEIVMMALQLEDIPRLINFEHIHLSRETYVELLGQLSRHDYVWTNTGWNTCAVHRSIVLDRAGANGGPR